MVVPSRVEGVGGAVVRCSVLDVEVCRVVVVAQHVRLGVGVETR